jgi:hypothetical protein
MSEGMHEGGGERVGPGAAALMGGTAEDLGGAEEGLHHGRQEREPPDGDRPGTGPWPFSRRTMGLRGEVDAHEPGAGAPTSRRQVLRELRFIFGD